MRIGDIWVIEATGGQPRELVKHPADDHLPSWSRDGKWIYFSSHRTGAPQIYRVPAAGGEPVQLTQNGGYTAFPSFDGKTIYYTRSDMNTGPVFAKPVDGGEERQVIESVTGRAFVVKEDGIYFIGVRKPEGYDPLQFLDLARDKSTQTGKIPRRIALGLSVSPDRKRFLYTGLTQGGGHLRLVENFR